MAAYEYDLTPEPVTAAQALLHEAQSSASRWQSKAERLQAERDELAREVERLRDDKNSAYEERNRLVSLLAAIFPAGVKRTNIPGWSDDWHGCVYINFPWGQASWHFHDSQAHLFKHLPEYLGEWDGHTTEEKYAAIARAALKGDTDERA